MLLGFSNNIDNTLYELIIIRFSKLRVIQEYVRVHSKSNTNIPSIVTAIEMSRSQTNKEIHLAYILRQKPWKIKDFKLVFVLTLFNSFDYKLYELVIIRLSKFRVIRE